jgi:hypothetical protein
MFGDKPRHNRNDAVDERIVAPGAIGKTGVIRDIDVTGVGPKFRNFTEYSQSAEARVENKDAGGAGHEEFRRFFLER